jgi:N-acetylmuramoyl-L-alanine amidase
MILSACSKITEDDRMVSKKAETERTNDSSADNQATKDALSISSPLHNNSKEDLNEIKGITPVLVTNKTSSSDDTKKESSLVKVTEKKKIIAIDAGHQSKGNYATEPIGPGATSKKAKVSSGTQGIYTKVPEYKLTLAIAKKLKKELVSRGYEIVMIREKHDVNLSNRERAKIANESGADIFIRIHADGSTNSKVSGASTLYPSKKNPYVSQLSKDSYNLSKEIVDALCKETGTKNRGAIPRDDMSGINWCEIPVSIIEMGYMSNVKEDKQMQKKDYQNKIVQGICDGIDHYFEQD